MNKIKTILNNSWQDEDVERARKWANALQVVAWVLFVGCFFIGFLMGLNEKKISDAIFWLLCYPAAGAFLLILLSALAAALHGIAKMTENSLIVAKLVTEKMKLVFDKQDSLISKKNS